MKWHVLFYALLNNFNKIKVAISQCNLCIRWAFNQICTATAAAAVVAAAAAAAAAIVIVIVVDTADTPNAYSSSKNKNRSRGLWGPLRGHDVFSERLLLHYR